MNFLGVRGTLVIVAKEITDISAGWITVVELGPQKKLPDFYRDREENILYLSNTQKHIKRKQPC